MNENDSRIIHLSNEKNENVLSLNDEIEIAKITNCEEIVKRYLNKISKIFYKLEIKKTNEGLSNFIYFINVDDNLKLFMKIFNNKIDRKFEQKIIIINAELGNCAKILDTDNENYRIEEFMENIQKLEKAEVLKEGFHTILINKIINFNYLLIDERDKYINEKNVFNILKKIFKIAQNSFCIFKEKFFQWRMKNKNSCPGISNINKADINNKYSIEKEEISLAFNFDNFSRIEDYLSEGKLEEILNEIFPIDFLKILKNNEKEVDLKNLPLVLSHNDVHQYNLIYRGKNEKEKNNKVLKEDNILLIDYEYACFNLIGFDIVNFFIECFFNLDLPIYPFYERVVESTKNIYDKFYFEKYLTYINSFIKHSKLINKFEDIFKINDIEIFYSYDYYCKICKFASIYWFYTALQFLDFESNMSRIGFNYIDYSIDRLSIYENYFNKN